MAEVVSFPPRSLVGELVKVCRHGECLWLKVKSTRLSGNLVAVLDNHPVEWPEGFGDAVEIRADEIVRIWGQTA